MLHKYNPEKPAPKVKFLEPSSRQSASKFRPTFLLNGVDYVASTPIRNLPAKTEYHCLKPSSDVKKYPSKKALKTSIPSPRIRRILNNILAKPQPHPVRPRRFKKEAVNQITLEDISARIQTAQAAQHRAHQEELRRTLHEQIEQHITWEAEEKGVFDCESCC